MATRKKDVIEKALQSDAPERFRMGEMGNLGLKVFNGVTNAELKRELNFPNNVQTYKEMSYHPAINAPLTLFENIISKATWLVVPPKDATEKEKNQCKLIESMMHDMDQPWEDFIKDSLSSLRYGFAVHEKVYYRRYASNGSLFNDGVTGWKKIPIRAQESIDRFVFSEDGNDIIGVKQNLSRLNDTFGRYANRAESEIVIPRSKFLLFRTGNHRGDPYGVSPLRDAYLAWKFLTAMEDMEATGVAKDLQGLPVLSLPAQYMAADAPAEVVALRQYYENFMRNLQVGEQSAVMLPMIYDEASKQPLFKLELLSVDGKKNFDIAKIKEYYKALIFTSLFSGILTLGDTSTGSFALGSIKNSMSGSYAYKLLKEVTTMLNRDLIRQTYVLNGWDTSRMGMLDFDGLEESDLETFSKAVQRMGATGYLPKTIDVVNTVLDSLGMDALPEGTVLEDVLPDSTSKSGEGMKTSFSGTRTTMNESNESDLNMENSS